MAGILGTVWEGVGLKRLRAGPDPDAPPRAVAIPAAWLDAADPEGEDAGAALAALAPGEGPVTLPGLAEEWIRRLAARGRRLGLLASPEEAETLMQGLRALLLARRGAPGLDFWQDGKPGEPRFVLNLPAFLDAEGAFDAAAYAAAAALGVRALDIWGQGRATRLRLGFADLAGLLAAFGLAYDSAEARAAAAAIAALTRGAAAAESGRLAERFGAREPVALIWPSPPTATAIPGLAEAARAALDTAAGSPGLRHAACIALAAADAVEALLGAETAGLAPACGAFRATRDALGTLTHHPTRAARRAGADAARLLAPVDPRARSAMEAAVMPFLDAAPPAPAALAGPPRPWTPPARSPATPASRGWQVSIGGQRLALRILEHEGRLREIAFHLPRDNAARALLDGLAQSVNLGLAHGTPLEAYVTAFAYGGGGPAGLVEGDPQIRRATSVLDWAFRRLAMEYLGRRDLPDPAEEETTAAPANSDVPLLPLDLPAAPSPRRKRALRAAA